MVTVRSGSMFMYSSTNTPAAPSVPVNELASNHTRTAGSSSSLMLTVVVRVEPALTPGGNVPKDSLTFSSSSSMVSSVALKEMVLDVSPLAKVTLSGTE